MNVIAGLVGRNEANELVILALGAARIEERDGWRPEAAKTLQQRSIIVVVFRYVGAQQHERFERADYPWLGKRVFLHLLAGNTPVCREV